MQYLFESLFAEVSRLGVVLEPDGSEEEAEGILNPASARDREGNLVLYTRSVARGNVSRIGTVKVTKSSGKLKFQRCGFALVPEADYEFNGAVGHGLEDPRVTYVACLDKYLMLYTAYGAAGPRVAVAVSDDAYHFTRIGLMQFPESLNLSPDDKDAAFFPEPVFSPSGVKSIAFYHRPMVHIAPEGGLSEIQTVLAKEPAQRQSIRIAYVPLAAVLDDIKNLTKVEESHLVLSPNENWGKVKVGGGTPAVRIREGWLSLYHGVDAVEREPGRYAMRYAAGVIVHDAERPHIVRYHSEVPLFVPETKEELTGTVNNVVFPTALDPRNGRRKNPEQFPDAFDVYYGMADFRIGRLKVTLRRQRGKKTPSGTGKQKR